MNSTKKTLPPQSIRELGIGIGELETGEFNNITDVKGVKVGHCTMKNGEAVRTGITMIMPNDNIFNKKLIAGSFILNGAGEVSGLTQVNEWGILETPIALTSTMAVGKVSEGISKWMSKKFKKIWDQRYVIIPVVGECDDSFLNDAINFPIDDHHVIEAIKDCRAGEILQGSVGGGTGMVCFDFQGGIGSSSRVFKIGHLQYTIGVLVMSNFGYMKDLRVQGYPLGQILESTQGSYSMRKSNYGSIITVVATDMPNSINQINRLCRRAALGIGRVGSFAAHESGEIIVGFSTANSVSHGKKRPHYSLSVIREDYIDLAYRAVIEATEEAICNSLTFSDSQSGVDGNFAPGIDRGRLQEIYFKFDKTRKSMC